MESNHNAAKSESEAEFDSTEFIAYRIAGYFRGVLIFVIFVVHQLRNFPPTKIYPRTFQIWTGDVLLWLFSLHLRLIDSVLDTQGPLSQQAVPRVMAKEVNREL